MLSGLSGSRLRSLTMIPPLNDGSPPRVSWRGHLRARLFAGLCLVLPLGVSLWLVNLLFNLVDRLLTHRLLEAAGLEAPPAPSTVWTLRVLALGLAGAALYLVGLFGTNVLGRRLLKGVEIWLEKIPVFGGVYRATRQLADALRAGGRQTFRRCVLVEFPRTGVFTLGFVSNEKTFPLGQPPRDHVAVYVPTTPNPTSGYFQLFALEECLPLDLTVEEGIKIIVSGGIVMPADFPSAPGLYSGEEDLP